MSWPSRNFVSLRLFINTAIIIFSFFIGNIPSVLCNCKGDDKKMDNYTFRPPLDLFEVSFLLPYTSKATCRAATSITYTDYAHAPHYVWGNKNRISPRCCPTMDKTFSRKTETLKGYFIRKLFTSMSLICRVKVSGILLAPQTRHR